jgi:hypothetical protein
MTTIEIGKKPIYNIIDGVLYKNGEVCPIVFGDQEQIDFLKKMSDLKEAIANGEISVDIEIETTHTATTSAKCICGGTVFFEMEVSHESDKKSLLGAKRSCRVCNAVHTIGYDIEKDSYIVKRLEK